MKLLFLTDAGAQVTVSPLQQSMLDSKQSQWLLTEEGPWSLTAAEQFHSGTSSILG